MLTIEDLKDTDFPVRVKILTNGVTITVDTKEELQTRSGYEILNLNDTTLLVRHLSDDQIRPGLQYYGLNNQDVVMTVSYIDHDRDDSVNFIKRIKDGPSSSSPNHFYLHMKLECAVVTDDDGNPIYDLDLVRRHIHDIPEKFRDQVKGE